MTSAQPLAVRGWWHRCLLFANRRRELILLAGIILLAVIFRFWNLSDLPPGLHPDEAANGQDVFRILAGDIRPLYDTNGPREALFHFLLTPFVALGGTSILVLRLLPAALGVAAVILTYLFVREWFSRRAALLAAFLLASAPWAVTLTRDVFRAALIPVMIPLTLWLYTRALKTGLIRWYVLTGISFGLGFYTYLSFRVTPFIILAVAAYALWLYRRQLLSQIKPLLITAAVSLAVVLPLAVFAVFHPDDVIGGRSSVSFLNEDLNQGQPAQTLLTTMAQTALMFNFEGDPNYRHNLGGEPMLNFFVGIMFILGVGLALTRIRDIRYFTLLAILGFMLVPMVLTAEGIPHGLRAIGVIPVVYVLAAIGVVELIARWRGVFPRNPAAKAVGLVLLLGLLSFSTISNYHRYFVAYANAPATYEAYSEDIVAIADYMLAHPIDGRYFLVIDGYSLKTVDYLAHNQAEYTQVDAGNVASLDLESGDTVVVAATRLDEAGASLAALPAEFTVEPHTSPHRTGLELFRVYKVK